MISDIISDFLLVKVADCNDEQEKDTRNVHRIAIDDAADKLHVESEKHKHGCAGKLFHHVVCGQSQFLYWNVLV